MGDPLSPLANPLIPQDSNTDLDPTAVLASWQITPEEHARILHTQIIPSELPLPSVDPPSPSHRPLTIFILGQTGAGKTRLAPLLHAALASPPPPPSSSSSSTPPSNLLPSPPSTSSSVSTPTPASSSPLPVAHLIADHHKRYHPFYHRCLTHPSPLIARHASALAGSAAADWLHAVCVCAAERRLDVLVEAACRRRGDIQRLVRVFSSSSGTMEGGEGGGECGEGEDGGDGEGARNGNAEEEQGNGNAEEEKNGDAEGKRNRQGEREVGGEGYRVRVVVLAVPAALSRLGILVRYYQNLPEGGLGRGLPVRLTPKKVHDESFEGLKEAVGWLDRDSDEGGDGNDQRQWGGVERVVVLRRGGLVAYKNKKGARGGALEALEVERSRGLSVEERRAAEKDIRMLRELRDPKVDKELDEIDGLLAGLGGGPVGAISELEPFDVDEFVSGR